MLMRKGRKKKRRSSQQIPLREEYLKWARAQVKETGAPAFICKA